MKIFASVLLLLVLCGVALGGVSPGWPPPSYVMQQQWQNIMDYGAKRDTSVDASTAFSDALSALGDSGGVIFIPSGDFKLDDTFHLNKSNVRIVGAGEASRIFIDSAGTALISIEASKVSLENFTIICSDTSYSNGVIYTDSTGVDDIFISKIRFHGGGNHIRFHTSNDFTIENTYHDSLTARGYPISLWNCSRGLIKGVTIRDYIAIPGGTHTQRCIYVQNSEHIRVIAPSVNNIDFTRINTGAAITFYNSSNCLLDGAIMTNLINGEGALTENGSHDILISNSIFRDIGIVSGVGDNYANGDGVDIFNSYRIAISNCIASNNGTVYEPYERYHPGFEIWGCTEVLISNCIANGNGLDGYRVVNSAKVTLISCEANKNRQNGAYFVASAAVANTIVDTVFRSSGSSFNDGWRYGTRIMVNDVEYLIDSVLSADTLILQTSAGSQSEINVQMLPYECRVIGGRYCDNNEGDYADVWKQNGIYFDAGDKNLVMGVVANDADSIGAKLQVYGARVQGASRVTLVNNDFEFNSDSNTYHDATGYSTTVTFSSPVMERGIGFVTDNDTITVDSTGLGASISLMDDGQTYNRGAVIFFGGGYDVNKRYAAIKGELYTANNNHAGHLSFYTRPNEANTYLSRAMRLDYTGKMRLGGSDGFVFPNTDGTADYVLTTDGSGTASWQAAPAGGADADSIRGKPVSQVAPTDNYILIFDAAKDSIMWEVETGGAGTVDSFYVIFTDSASAANGNNHVNGYLTPSDTLYIDTTDNTDSHWAFRDSTTIVYVNDSTGDTNVFIQDTTGFRGLRVSGIITDTLTVNNYMKVHHIYADEEGSYKIRIWDTVVFCNPNVRPSYSPNQTYYLDSNFITMEHIKKLISDSVVAGSGFWTFRDSTTIVYVNDSTGDTVIFIQDTTGLQGMRVVGNIVVSGTVDGVDVLELHTDYATDSTKLAGVESGATADQTPTEILNVLRDSISGDATVGAAGALTIAANAIESTMIGADQVNDLDINFGTGTDQVSTDDVTEGTAKYNVTHTGAVTGATELTITDSAVTVGKIDHSDAETNWLDAVYAPLGAGAWVASGDTLFLVDATGDTLAAFWDDNAGNVRWQVATEDQTLKIKVDSLDIGGEVLTDLSSTTITVSNGQLIVSSISTSQIINQTIIPHDIDTTAYNFPFDGAYHVTSATEDSSYITIQTLEDTAALRLPLAGGALTGPVTTNSTFDTVDVATLAAKVHNEDLKHFIFALADPNALYDIDSIFCIKPVTEKAITVTRIDVTCNADPTTEPAMSLRFADNFISRTTPTTIDVITTTAGVTAITSGFDDATIPASSCIYFVFTADPEDALKSITVDITYIID